MATTSLHWPVARGAPHVDGAGVSSTTCIVGFLCGGFELTPSILVTAPDPELKAILRLAFVRTFFATAEQVRAIISVKPGSMVVVIDEGHAHLVSGLLRKDVRAVALVTPKTVPVIFRRPIVAVVERPLFAPQVVTAIKLALSELGP